MNLDQIKKFVKIKHGNQKRMQGTPYYLHPFAVAEILANFGYDINYQIAALFHDLFEDTNTTYEELLELSNINIVNAVKLVTKEQNYKMENYINRIKKNDIAKMVKLADRAHNLSEAKFASNKWIKEYILETKMWYLELVKDTVFEKIFQDLIQELEIKINKGEIT